MTNMTRALWAFAAIPLAFVLLLALLPKTDPAADADRPLLIRGALMFDGLEDRGVQDVLIVDGRIARIAPSISPPAGSEVMDATGQTLLPGLIDAHTHAFAQDALRQALRFGVTTELDMFTNPAFAAANHQGRDKTAPRDRADLYSAGYLATSPGGHGTQFGVQVPTLSGPDAAEAWVAARVEESSDYIKIVYDARAQGRPFTSIDRATLSALVKAAHGAGKLAVVHAMDRLSAAHAVAAGADGLVHIFGDAPVTAGLLADMRAQNVFVIPTLSVLETVAKGRGGLAFDQDADFLARLTPSERAALETGFPKALRKPGWLRTAQANVKALHQAGIAILAGSDAPNPGTLHGASLHGEMALLVAAGLTPEQALTAATATPARRFDLAGRGRIAEGARADLVLVAGNPLADIAATRRLTHVVKNGRPVPIDPPATATGGRVQPRRLADFSEDVIASGRWGTTTDDRMGGQSTATLSQSDGVLTVRGEVRPGFIAPWAGVYHAFAADWQTTRDLRGIDRLRFRVRGRPGRYRVLLFGGDIQNQPVEQTFPVTEDWQTVSVALKDFRGVPLDQVRALSFAAGPQPGAFSLSLDKIELEKD